jgi:hypothetical protein
MKYITLGLVASSLSLLIATPVFSQDVLPSKGTPSPVEKAIWSTGSCISSNYAFTERTLQNPEGVNVRTRNSVNKQQAILKSGLPGAKITILSSNNEDLIVFITLENQEGFEQTICQNIPKF